ncbi:2Fe-2S iron-sulfur cluster binding domain-containing protein [Erythrobacter arachoides]|uniref:2Fe-2S iron-sulfur cluster binding domain-containing protein n=1 Tax=Aurantiacibacter arachoides TaxID=1850444 RepID=A0A845A227_9SPHN|nr:2Fe-2S iron-sulfur cluster-binding protein [Aurantiacibacter arachoides]MXO93630.1 2Fe-2S iron-sulfur cluster binding domain-containing protein [Aurantiacibacter arachoides]GGD47914.1 (2Fe-2S) ferredoxin [Aurantiacibacter arachoides]
MVAITFIDHAGTARQVEAEPGSTLMRAARDNGIPGVVAECGGMAACATCHVFVEAACLPFTGDMGEDEDALLDFADDRAPNSRLSCQIAITPELDGMTVTTPEHQG